MSDSSARSKAILAAFGIAGPWDQVCDMPIEDLVHDSLELVRGLVELEDRYRLRIDDEALESRVPLRGIAEHYAREV